MENKSIFNKYIKPFLDKAECSMKDSISSNTIGISFPSIYGYLADEIRMMSIFALIYELNLFREENKLKGDTPEERYVYFENYIGSQEFQEYFFAKYPVLETFINKKIDNTVKYVRSIIDNFSADLADIETVFGLEVDGIRDIVLGKGDTHNDGQTVAFIIGNFGKLVYKPHSLKSDVILNEFIDIVNADLEKKLRKTVVLNRECYGWQEFIEFEQCESLEQIENFYYRMGAYLGIFYLFNAGDMHYENILSKGEYPVFIDTETLVTNSAMDLESSLMEKNTQFDTVLSTCLLPINNSNTLIDFDMSGIDGGVLNSDKIKSVRIENIGKDFMKIKRDLLNTKTEENNIPTLNGKKVDPKKFVGYMIKGFSTLLEVVMVKKTIITSYILDIDKEWEQRQLFRHTYVYAKFLEASLNPEYLVSEEKRNELLGLLLKNNNSFRIKNEVSSLKERNIPYYYSKFGYKDMFSSGRVIVENYYKNTGLDTVLYKVNSLNEEKILHQSRIIELSFLSKMKNIFLKEDPTKASKSRLDKTDNLMSTICGTVKDILTSEYFDGVNHLPDMYMVKLNPNETMLSSINSSLYEGGGLLWFLYQYCLINQKQDDSQKYFNMLKRKLIADKEYTSLSMYDGIGSDLYLSVLLYEDTEDMDMYLNIRTLLTRLDGMINTVEINFDYLNGISGIVELIYKLKQHYDFEILDSIVNKIKKIMSNFDFNEFGNVVGLAHGISGIQLAFAILFELTKEDYFYEKLLSMNEAEENIINSCEDIPNYWCRGYAGILLSRVKMMSLIKKEHDRALFHNQVDKYLTKVLKINDGDNMCLCHGIYGLLDVLISLKKTYNNLLRQEQIRIIQAVIEEWSAVPLSKENINICTKYGFQYDGFMLGNSGVLYVGLRLIDNNIISILNMDIAVN